MRKSKISSPAARKETKREYRARQARLDALYPQRHVVCTLQEFACYAADINGEPVHLKDCAAFTDFGAMQVARNTMRRMTKIQMMWLRLRRRSPIWVEVRTVDADFESIPRKIA